MNWPEELQRVSDAAVASFAAITTVTAIVPVARSEGVAANAATFDYLPPVANHIYFLENVDIVETIAITGLPNVRIYDLTPTVTVLFGVNIQRSFNARSLWCTRLEHAVNGATVGFYSIVYYGFDITYT